MIPKIVVAITATTIPDMRADLLEEEEEDD